MEESKAVALHETLAKLKRSAGLGVASHYNFAGRPPRANGGTGRADGLPDNPLYAPFVREGTYDPATADARRYGDGRAIKRNFDDCEASGGDSGGDGTTKKSRRKREEKERRKAEKKATKLEAKRQAKLEAKRAAKLEAKRQEKLEAKRQAKLEAKRQAKLEAKRQAKLDAKQQAKPDAKRQAKPDAKRRGRSSEPTDASVDSKIAEDDRDAALTKKQKKGKGKKKRKRGVADDSAEAVERVADDGRKATGKKEKKSKDKKKRKRDESAERPIQKAGAATPAPRRRKSIRGC